MREIKFRGFYFKEKNALYDEVKKWVYGSLVIDEDEYRIREYAKKNQSCINSYKVDPETVGQFTGLQDSKGIDIYEGDILQYKENNYKVYWVDNEYRFNVARFNKKNSLDMLSNLNYFEESGIEVIGNIYDNPELLEDTK